MGPGNVLGLRLHRRAGSGRRGKSSGWPRFTTGDAGKPATKRDDSRSQGGGCGGLSS